MIQWRGFRSTRYELCRNMSGTLYGGSGSVLLMDYPVYLLAMLHEHSNMDALVHGCDCGVGIMPA